MIILIHFLFNSFVESSLPRLGESHGIMEIKMFQARTGFESVPKLNDNCRSVGEVEDDGTLRYTDFLKYFKLIILKINH